MTDITDRLAEAERREAALREAAKWLCYCARTSGGTAGLDVHLQKACEQTEKTLAATEKKP